MMHTLIGSPYAPPKRDRHVVSTVSTEGRITVSLSCRWISCHWKYHRRFDGSVEGRKKR